MGDRVSGMGVGVSRNVVGVPLFGTECLVHQGGGRGRGPWRGDWIPGREIWHQQPREDEAREMEHRTCCCKEQRGRWVSDGFNRVRMPKMCN